MATRLSDLGIKPQEDGKKIFDCPQVQITSVINCEIEILDYIPDMETAHGTGRYLIHFRLDGREGKFFTNASKIKSVLDQVPKESFPIFATVKSAQLGNNKSYTLV